MTHPVDVHPEELLDREQLGQLSADEQRRLDAHATQCAACALVRSATVDFASERAPAASDDAMAERLIAAAMGRPLASTPPPSGVLLAPATQAKRMGGCRRGHVRGHRSHRLVLVGSPRVHPASAR